MSVGTELRQALRVKPFRYQVRGVRFAQKHDGRVLICDDMGLGKTLQSIGWIAINPEARPVLIVCPASLKYAWQRELRKLAKLRSYVCEGKLLSPAAFEAWRKTRLRAVRKKKFSQSRLRRRAILRVKAEIKARQLEIKRSLGLLKKQEIVIINYDILSDWVWALEARLKPVALVLDECQAIQNRNAKRTEAVVHLGRKAEHVIGLSGTPFTSNPIQFYPALNLVRPDEFPSFWKFGMQYCDPKKNRFSGGYDFTGASNLDELHERLKSVMIRRLKKDVLKDLPSKIRSVIPVAISNRTEYDKAEKDFLRWVKKNKGQVAYDKAKRAEALVRLGQLLQLAAAGKLKFLFQWIEDWLADTDQKLILFARHSSVISQLVKKYPNAARIDGSVSPRQRLKEVEKFQNDPKCRLFIGHTKAAGTGVDGLQKASSSVAFVEIGWTPAEHQQAEDRALRIGQKDTVNVYYMVGKNTIEERLLEILELKEAMLARVLDGKKGKSVSLLDKFLIGVRMGEARQAEKRYRVKRIRRRA